MKTRNIAFGLVLVLASSCAGLEVITDQKPGVDFNNYKTYTIEYENKLGTQNQYFNELNQGRFDEAFQQALENRGMEAVEDQPDVHIKVIADIESNTNYRTTYNNNMIVGRRYYYGGGMGSSDTREYQTNTGQLTVALVDGENEELLWYTAFSQELRGKPKKVEEKINQAVERFMEIFPIDHNSSAPPLARMPKN